MGARGWALFCESRRPAWIDGHGLIASHRLASRPDGALMKFDVDIFQPAAFMAGFPHETFERLRREDPVHWTEESLSPEFPWARVPGPGYWAVTRHADV